MPPVVAGISAVASAIAGSALLSTAVGVATSFAINYVASKIAGKPKLPDASPPALRDRTLTGYASNSPRQIVYGATRCPGDELFLESTGDGEYLHMVIAFAGHEVEAIDAIYFDGVEVQLDGGGNGVGTWSGLVRIHKHLGEWNQAADAALVAECPSVVATDRLRGIAYVYVRLKWDAEVFQSGRPSVTADVRGRKVYDWRASGQNAADPSSWTFSKNAALVALDWVRGVPVRNEAGEVVPLLRRGMPVSVIDGAAAISEANICDEVVNLAGGGTERRYEASGILNTGVDEFSGLATLLSACAGRIGFTGGVVTLRAGAARTPEDRTITEADIIGPIKARPYRPRDELFNSVQGQHVGPATAWKSGDFPAYSEPSFVDQDNGEKIWADLDFPFTVSSAAAQRLARLELALNRRQATLDLRCSYAAVQYRVGDWVRVTIPKRGWDEKVFLITDFRLSVIEGEGGMVPVVDLSLNEIDANVYAWAAGEAAVDEAPLTNLPNPLVMPPPLGLDLLLERWAVDGRVTLTATPPVGGPPLRYEWRYRRAGGLAYTVLPRTSDPETSVSIAEVGTYEFEVRAVEASGPAVSSWVVKSTRVEPANDLPRIAGLEIAGGGHSREFVGPDVQLVWRDTRRDGPAGFEVDQVLSGARRDEDFKHYRVTVYTDGEAVMRDVTTLEPSFYYSLDMNRRDARRLGLATAQRRLIIGVRHVSVHHEGPETRIIVSNPAPAALTSLAPVGTALSLYVPFDFDNLDDDHEGFILKASQVTGFDPATEGEVVFQGNSVARATVDAGTWYIRVAAYDAFGTADLNWSSEIEVGVGGAVEPEVIDAIQADIDAILNTDLPALAGRVDTVEDQYVLQLVDGETGKVVAGYRLSDGTGAGSTFTILASIFAVVSEAADGELQYPFVIDGEGKVTIRNAFIRDLTGENINVDNLAAFSADLGEIVAGLMRSADNTVQFSLNDKFLLMSV